MPPRYGISTKRRHQLHEVIRLSGMNLVVNDLDIPVINKVTSVREDSGLFLSIMMNILSNKATFADEEIVLYPNNDERNNILQRRCRKR